MIHEPGYHSQDKFDLSSFIQTGIAWFYYKGRIVTIKFHPKIYKIFKIFFFKLVVMNTRDNDTIYHETTFKITTTLILVTQRRRKERNTFYRILTMRTINILTKSVLLNILFKNHVTYPNKCK